MYVIIGNLGKKLRNLAKVLVLLLALGVLVPGAIAVQPLRTGGFNLAAGEKSGGGADANRAPGENLV